MEHYEGGHEYAEQEKNVLGIVGFALSFCTGPIGLIISLIALTKRPKGFAIAGVIISLISTAVLGTVVFGGVWFAKKFGAHMMAVADLGKDFMDIQQSVSAYHAQNGAYPPDLATAGVSGGALEDTNGMAYGYAVKADGTGWTLTWAGMDQQMGTGDDLVVDGSSSQNQMQATFNDYFEQHAEEIVRDNK